MAQLLGDARLAPDSAEKLKDGYWDPYVRFPRYQALANRAGFWPVYVNTRLKKFDS
jgi:hypothetical protein